MEQASQPYNRTVSAGDAGMETTPDREATGSNFAEKISVCSSLSEDYLVTKKVHDDVPVTRPSRFFDLPGELRNQIYGLIFSVPEITVVIESEGKLLIHFFDTERNSSPPPGASLLRTNRQFKAEASAYIYTPTTFCFTYLHLLNRFLKQIGTQVQYLRHIELALPYCGCSRPSFGLSCDRLHEMLGLDSATQLKNLTIRMQYATGLGEWQSFVSVRTWYRVLKKWVENVGKAKGDSFAALDLLRVRCFQSCDVWPPEGAEDAFEKECLSDFRKYIEGDIHDSNQTSIYRFSEGRSTLHQRRIGVQTGHWFSVE